MALFLSTFVNKVDKKGRVSIPASFRKAIMMDKSYGGNSIVIYPSFLNNCVEACSMKRIEQILESIENMDTFSEEKDAFAMSILGGSMELTFDTEGRVKLPEEIMAEANITNRAAFVGKGRSFEIWEPSAVSKYAKQARAIAKKRRLSFGVATNNFKITKAASCIGEERHD